MKENPARVPIELRSPHSLGIASAELPYAIRGVRPVEIICWRHRQLQQLGELGFLARRTRGVLAGCRKSPVWIVQTLAALRFAADDISTSMANPQLGHRGGVPFAVGCWPLLLRNTETDGSHRER